ncbi:hypothetical protein PYCC9005_005525 [Savitreella phatthalungensis]
MAEELCEDITSLKDWLRLSRALVDDTITTNLNNLRLPKPFDPLSTTASSPNRRSTATQTEQLDAPIDQTSCDRLVDAVFANWAARSTLLAACSSRVHPSPTTTATPIADAGGGDRWTRKRYDPYAGRATASPPILQTVVEGELATEEIVRDRTWSVIRNRCRNLASTVRDAPSWHAALQDWVSRQAADRSP